MTATTLLLLYLTFRFKQLTGDYLLQTDWMAMNKGMPGIGGYRALVSHTSVHAAGTFIVMLIFAPALWWLGIVDFLVHSFVDRTKGVMTYKKQWTYKDRWFWWSFGMDQEAHNLTHLAFIVIVVMHYGGIV